MSIPTPICLKNGRNTAYLAKMAAWSSIRSSAFGIVEGMQIQGDETGIAQLKELAKENKEYLKYLINEARSNTDHLTSYRGGNGVKYAVKIDVKTQTITVRPAQDD